MNLSHTIIQALLMLLAAPGLSGLVRAIKNALRMRSGAPLLQPYYNFFKLLAKEEVVSRQASWIFHAAPLVVLGSAITTLLFFAAPDLGDLLLIIFLLSLGRFFLALAGLDCGSAFGGMGSSREMFISSLVEPVALLSVFIVCLNCGNTSVAAIISSPALKISTFFAGLSLFMVVLAETSRIPVDNQETHLELTMVHEAMLLEYSGRSLALLELAAHIKQIIFFTLLAYMIMPGGGALSGYGQGALSVLIVIGLAMVVAVLEVSLAKMRLFRVVDFLGFALVIAIMALVIQVMGL